MAKVGQVVTIGEAISLTLDIARHTWDYVRTKIVWIRIPFLPGELKGAYNGGDVSDCGYSR